MTIDYKSGNLDAAWGIPVAQFRTLESEPGTEALAYPYYNWEYLNFNCFDSPTRSALRCSRTGSFRNAHQLRDRPREALRHRLPGLRRAGHHHRPAEDLEGPRLPLAAGGRPRRWASTWRRPAGCSTRPATRSRTASAWTSRASRSPCVCTRPPTTCRRRPRASSSPAGSQELGIDDRVLGARRGRPQRPRLELRGRRVPARLRHVHRQLAGLRRPRPDADRRGHAGRSAPPTSRAGRTRSTTSSPTSRRRSSTPRSASSRSGGCSRSCTSRRRGSSSPTPTSSRPTTRPTGRAGRA